MAELFLGLFATTKLQACHCEEPCPPGIFVNPISYNVLSRDLQNREKGGDEFLVCMIKHGLMRHRFSNHTKQEVP